MLLLKNGRTTKGTPIHLLIADGKIKSIYQDLQRFYQEYPPCQSCVASICEIDLRTAYVMPGLIDLHTHMRDPGLTQKEDFATGSRACAKGGITTFFDMPNTVPATTTVDSLHAKIAVASRCSQVNFGFHFGASKNDNISEIRQAYTSGLVKSTKVFLNVSTGEMLIQDKKLLAKVFQASPLVFVHAEDEMIDTALKLNAAYGSGLYICHISSEREMQKVIRAKESGKLNPSHAPVYAEVTPHHLFLHQGMNTDDSLLLRMKPELKLPQDNAFLLEAVRQGYVDTIGTDHAPHLLAEKMSKLTFGIPGVETALALMLSAVHRNELPLPLIERLMAANPASIMQMPCKGRLEEGCDADIIAVSTDEQWTFKQEDIVSKCGWSPYTGWTFNGKNRLTMVNGHIVYYDKCFFTANEPLKRMSAGISAEHTGRFVFSGYDNQPDVSSTADSTGFF